MPTNLADDRRYTGECTFEGPVTFNDDVTFGQTPPEISLENLENLTGTGTATFADLVAEDDLTVGDDAAVGGDLAVTGNYTSAAGNITLTAGTVSAEQLTSTDDLTVADDAAIGGDLTVTGAISAASLSLGGAAVVPERRYVSQTITHADLTAGASCVVQLTGEPSGAYIPIAAYLVTSAETTITGEDTTDISCQVGIGSDDDALVKDTSVAGTAGRKGSASGAAFLGRVQDAGTSIFATFTATGDSPDCADVTALSLRVVVLYRELTSEF